MVLGQADRPLLQRHVDVTDLDAPFGVEALLAAFAAEHERARIRRVGQQVVHGAIAGPGPADAALPDRPARQLLALGDEFDHDLARRSEPPPQREDVLDRVSHLLIRAQHDPIVIVAIEPDRQRQPQRTPGGLVPEPAVHARADQVQLGL